MNLTNTFNLPEPIVRAIQNDPYSPGDCDISTTRLIDAPRPVELKRRHAEDITEDVSERIWSLLGQSVHVILERAGGVDISEKRYFADVNGFRISGAIDLLDRDTIVDYKVTSTYTLIYGSRMREWAAQGNVNRWLYHKNGGTAAKLKNILILRDWTKSKAVADSAYPQVQIATVDLPVWNMEDTERYIKDRVSVHSSARALPDDVLPLCTDEERWARPTQFAAMKKGMKRAVKLFDVASEATAFAEANGLSVITRPGGYARCESYCTARAFCSLYKDAEAPVAVND